MRLFLYNDERCGLNLEAVVAFSMPIDLGGKKSAYVTMVNEKELLKLEGADVVRFLNEIRLLSAGM